MSLFVFILVLITAAIHATWNFLTKEVAGNLGVIVIGAWVGVIILLPFAAFSGVTVSSLQQVLPFMLATGLVHTVYFYTLGKSYEYGEISTVYPIARGVGVAGTALAAVLLLGEKVTPFGVAGILAVAVGATLIGFVHAGGRKARSVAFALVVGVCIMSYSLIDKSAAGIVHPTVYAVGLFGGAATFLSAYLYLRKREVLNEAWYKYRKFCFGIGIGLVGVYLIILSVYQVAQVSYVVAVREMSVVIGAILGFRLLGERVTMRKAVGIAAVALGLVLVKAA